MRDQIVRSRETHKEKGNNLFPFCALIRSTHQTSNADRWDAMVTCQVVDASLPLRFSRLVSQSFSSVSKNFYHFCKSFFYKPQKPSKSFLGSTIFFKAGVSNLPLTSKQHPNTNVSVLGACHLINWKGHTEKTVLSKPINMIVKTQNFK